MRLDEIAPGLLLEMAYTRKRAETIITGLEYQLNLHLLKLAVVPIADEYDHWRHEVTTWLATIAALRLKPLTKPAPASFYFTILFDEPFGGNEMAAVMARLQLLRQQYGQIDPEVRTEDLMVRLRAFHFAFAKGCGQGTMDLAGINALLAAFQ
jgi:hypothetical protein